jgi:hypothetical protein
MAKSAGNWSTRDLAEVETRLQALLEPYGAKLERATIYGLPTLRRPGAKAHEWFALVKPATKHVSLFLLPVHTSPVVAAAVSAILAPRLTGKATFTFRSLSDLEEAALAALLAIAYASYIGPASHPAVAAS